MLCLTRTWCLLLLLRPQDDLLVLPKDLARNCRNIQRLVLVQKVSAGIHVLDPTNGEVQLHTRHRCRRIVHTSYEYVV